MNIPLTPLRFLALFQPAISGPDRRRLRRQRLPTRISLTVPHAKLRIAILGIKSGERVAFLGANCHRLSRDIMAW